MSDDALTPDWIVPLHIEPGEDAEDFSVLKRELAVEGVQRGAGCVLTFMPAPRRLGMTAQELVLNVSLNIVTGVPASLMAAWLWERWTRRGKHTLVSREGDRLKTQQEVLAWLHRVFPQVTQVPDTPTGLQSQPLLKNLHQEISMKLDEQHCWEFKDGKLIAAVDPATGDGDVDANIAAAGYTTEITSKHDESHCGGDVTLYKNTSSTNGNPLFYIDIMGDMTGIGSLVASDFKQLTETLNYLSGLLVLIRMDQSSAIARSTAQQPMPRP